MINKDFRSYIGAMGEHLIVADLLQHGFQPHMPVTHNCPYDILATKGTIRFRVQVKYRTTHKGKVELTMRRQTIGGYVPYDNDYDIIAIVTNQNKIAYLTKYEVRRTVVLRVAKAKNNQVKRVREFNKYQCINAAIIRARDQSNSRLGKNGTRNKERS
jgi:hypothetical protein